MQPRASPRSNNQSVWIASLVFRPRRILLIFFLIARGSSRDPPNHSIASCIGCCSPTRMLCSAQHSTRISASFRPRYWIPLSPNGGALISALRLVCLDPTGPQPTNTCVSFDPWNGKTTQDSTCISTCSAHGSDALIWKWRPETQMAEVELSVGIGPLCLVPCVSSTLKPSNTVLRFAGRSFQLRCSESASFLLWLLCLFWPPLCLALRSSL